MARGITETDVWQAADALLLAGDRPTIERVRQQLGRGSPNTVSPHLDTWFRGLGARIKDPQAFAAPTAIPDPIHQAAAHFWQVALAAARAQVDSDLAAERARLGEAQAQLEGTRLELAQEEDRQSARREGMEAAMRATTAQLQTASDRVVSLGQQLAQSTCEMTELQGHSLSLVKDKETLRMQLEKERANHEAVRTKMEERAEANEQRWSLEVDRSREAAKLAQSQIAKSEKAHMERLATWNATRDRLEAELAAATMRSTRQQIDVDKVKEALSAAERTFQASSIVAARHEAALLSQIERLQAQLSGSLEQLRVKDAEQSAVLRSLLQNANADGKRSPGRRVPIKKPPKAE
ncbi:MULTISPECIES: DNA-binding protein [unclassified Duganella]|uniref:DNA-binding protein n=1 Tax=unclassified Duganella TaxID=2636909 RepID=UPI0008755870|nr:MULTISPECIES: DNA-binding protein [unclassified Duganella]OEZ63867.1 hypothetical protein DUGA6_03680 [Duganella sp. HH105]OFA06980.1 hypothetical protein DUGA2_03120 [Duganella sp. HH101]